MLAEIAAAVREGRVSPEELLGESLRRIEAHNPALNAVIALRAEQALREARTSARTGPLAGIPLLVKDLVDVAGMRTTNGSHLLADAPPAPHDALVVQRLRAAGAIVVGKTNTPAYGHTGFTTNAIFGATRNPWNLERSPGGSSGGSAAALAAGLSPLATTSDGGGSVRGPASLCGLVGWKPTNGIIGRERAPSWISYSTTGATGRTVADVILEGSVLAGSVFGDIMSPPNGSTSFVPLKPTRVVAVHSFRGAVAPVVSTAFDRMCALIADDLGLPITIVDRFTEVDCAWHWIATGSAELAQSLAADRDRWDEFEPTLRVLLDIGANLSLPDYIAGQRARYQAAADLDQLLDGDAVLISPTLNAESFPPEGPLPVEILGDRRLAVGFNTMDANFTGHPAVSVPMGHDSVGVPLGLQIMAPRFRDDLALGLATAIEQAAPWAHVAPGYEPWPTFSSIG
jgi:Asp-tRNA(Asn)/Glu-tRNA(Gln) amidotransferase A subunit family amidase